MDEESKKMGSKAMQRNNNKVVEAEKTKMWEQKQYRGENRNQLRGEMGDEAGAHCLLDSYGSRRY